MQKFPESVICTFVTRETSLSLLLPLLTSSSSLSTEEKLLCWAMVCNPLRADTYMQLLLSRGCLSAANLTCNEKVETQPDICHGRSGAIKKLLCVVSNIYTKARHVNSHGSAIHWALNFIVVNDLPT